MDAQLPVWARGFLRKIVAGGLAFVADFAMLRFCTDHLGLHYLNEKLMACLPT